VAPCKQKFAGGTLQTKRHNSKQNKVADAISVVSAFLCVKMSGFKTD